MPADRRKPGDRRPDDRPPICPACGVTMGIEIDADGNVGYVCLECGYPGDEA